MKDILMLVLGAFLSVYIYAQDCIIKNVTIVDTQNGSLHKEQDVLIRNGQIEKIGAEIPIPDGMFIVPGSDKYLMPGMADAHIHFFQSGGLYTRPDAIDLRHKVPYEKEKAFGLANAADYLHRYLRLGITTVIDVGGPMTNFLVRDSIAKSIVSPNVLVTGPLFSMIGLSEFGEDPPIIKITNEQEADALFEKMLSFRPDFIKIWYIASPDLPAEQNFALVKYIAEKTHEHGLKLTVHATELNTAVLAVKAGADILVHSVDDAIIPDEVIQEWKEKNVTYIPTLIVGMNYYKVFSGHLSHHPQDLQWANAFAYGSLSDPENMTETEMPTVLKVLRSRTIPADGFDIQSHPKTNLVNLYKAGVNVATGTDAGNIGTMHASSYIQELEAMQESGLSVAEILKASTINVARGFGREQFWGSIDEGKIADMLLLSENPFESLQHLSSIEIVFKDGRILYPDSILQESPEAVVQRQLNAYNARNMEAFLDTYAEDVQVYELHGNLIYDGKERLRMGYAEAFRNISNLHCSIENRIVVGSTIIDRETVRFGDRMLNGVTIYEVDEGRIKRMTFVQ